MALSAADMLDSSQLNTLKNIAREYNVDPNVILAIGWQETNWGRLGDGKLGMYTGYGSYDSGSNYGYNGFEKQVTGTAQKMAGWGMTPGGVTMDKLVAGQAGTLPTGIYAAETAGTRGNWAKNVFSIYSDLTGGGGITGTSSGFGGTGTTKDYGFLSNFMTNTFKPLVTDAVGITTPAADSWQNGWGLPGKISNIFVLEKWVLGGLILMVIVIGFISFFKATDINAPNLPIPGM